MFAVKGLQTGLYRQVKQKGSMHHQDGDLQANLVRAQP